MKIIGTPSAPTGLRRLLWRLPLYLYRLGLGRLFGHRWMLLTHTGRVSGKPRQTVLEVVEHGADHYIVASGFGTRADWYRNVRAHPEVTIETGGRRTTATAVMLPAAQGGDLMTRYAARRPRTARRLCRIMGFAIDGSAADYRAVGEHIPFIRFEVHA